MNYNNGNYGRGFNPSFTIPRRNEDGHNLFGSYNSNSVLNNAYGNIPNNYSNFQSNSSYMRRDEVFSSDPPKKFWGDSPWLNNRNTPNNSLNVFSRRTQFGINTTAGPKRQFEFDRNTNVKPTSTSDDIYGPTYNSSLPPELLSMYQPLFCKLCMMQFTTTKMSKLHYHSKNHEKSIRTWIKEHIDKTGKPSNEKATGKPPKTDETSNMTELRRAHIYGDCYDSTLPKELMELYQPLFCKLCMVQLSSNTMAKGHYHSKNHEKKVRVWLRDYSEKTGKPLHERATGKRQKTEDEFDPKYFHCDICDLDLTGKLHAESHYMGKNHQRALMGNKDPAGKGFYNEEGKWTRTVAAKDDKVSGDGFGQDFVKKDQPKMTKKERQDLQQQILKNKPFKCEVCDISVTSQEQMDIHLQGSKHKKKLMHKELGITLAQRLVGNEDDFIVGQEGTANESTTSDDPMAAYRTPSGYFYCKTCDLSLNSNVQFMQHLKSKKHKRKYGAQSLESMENPEEFVQPESSDDIFSHL